MSTAPTLLPASAFPLLNSWHEDLSAREPPLASCFPENFEIGLEISEFPHLMEEDCESAVDVSSAVEEPSYFRDDELPTDNFIDLTDYSVIDFTETSVASSVHHEYYEVSKHGQFTKVSKEFTQKWPGIYVKF